VRGIFWMLDNGAKRKDLPRKFGSLNAVHRCFQGWVHGRIFENIMRDAGQLVEEQGEYRLYECFIDGTFGKARGGGDGIGCTKAGKGVKSWSWSMREAFPSRLTRCPHRRTSPRWCKDFSTSC
jgi:hypothetical protein